MLNKLHVLNPMRSYQARAVLTAMLSLALVLAILFVFSTDWMNRSKLDVQRRRSQDLLRHLAARLELGVMVRSNDLIQPIAQDAFSSGEVKAIAVYAADGQLMLQLPATSDVLANYSPPSAAETEIPGDNIVAAEAWRFWILATDIHTASVIAANAAPADFQVVEAARDRIKIGTVAVYWDLTPSAQWLTAFQHRFLSYALASFLLVAGPTWLLTVYLNRGVSQLFAATQHVERGEFQYRIRSNRADELGDVMRAFDAMSGRLSEINEQLEEQRERAVAASKAKSEFLANMSHELRTPLNAIIGFSEVLLEPVFGDLTEKQQSYVNDILDSGRHLLSLINDILDLAKIEAGKMELEPESVDLRRLLTNSLRLVAERATRHRIDLVTDIAGNLNRVTADERKLKQLLFNLLSNAVKFTPDGGKVGIRAWRESDSVVISVSDTGIGIAADEQERIFQDFYQVENATVKSQQGTGLGLSLVHKIAKLHGGRVWVESGVGQGSRFFVELPQANGCLQETDATVPALV